MREKSCLDLDLKLGFWLHMLATYPLNRCNITIVQMYVDGLNFKLQAITITREYANHISLVVGNYSYCKNSVVSHLTKL